MARKTNSYPAIAIVGTAGVPARYGGFETLAANLAEYSESEAVDCDLSIYCSAKGYPERLESYHGACLHYIGLDANGPASPLYDLASIVAALRRGTDTILVLGVSGTLALPLLRLLTSARYVVNVDGIEWKRAKWNLASSLFLRLSEWAAARFAHCVIADNQAIVEHIWNTYSVRSQLIPYGGDHAGMGADALPQPGVTACLPEEYALLLCRIEPENNIHMALQAFAGSSLPLVAVGNWTASEYGRELHARYGETAGIILLDPVYDREALYPLRSRASLYIHGHSAGGTNPSLVEMMWLGRPVLAFDCEYNRHTTEGQALYYRDADELREQVRSTSPDIWAANGQSMKRLAHARYRWRSVGRRYFDVLLAEHPAARQ